MASHHISATFENGLDGCRMLGSCLVRLDSGGVFRGKATAKPWEMTNTRWISTVWDCCSTLRWVVLSLIITMALESDLRRVVASMSGDP